MATVEEGEGPDEALFMVAVPYVSQPRPQQDNDNLHDFLDFLRSHKTPDAGPSERAIEPLVVAHNVLVTAPQLGGHVEAVLGFHVIVSADRAVARRADESGDAIEYIRSQFPKTWTGAAVGNSPALQVGRWSYGKCKAPQNLTAITEIPSPTVAAQNAVRLMVAVCWRLEGHPLAARIRGEDLGMRYEDGSLMLVYRDPATVPPTTIYRCQLIGYDAEQDPVHLAELLAEKLNDWRLLEPDSKWRVHPYGKVLAAAVARYEPVVHEGRTLHHQPSIAALVFVEPEFEVFQESRMQTGVDEPDLGKALQLQWLIGPARDVLLPRHISHRGKDLDLRWSRWLHPANMPPDFEIPVHLTTPAPGTYPLKATWQVVYHDPGSPFAYTAADFEHLHNPTYRPTEP